jgi:hypothetical protein
MFNCEYRHAIPHSSGGLEGSGAGANMPEDMELSAGNLMGIKMLDRLY